MAHEECVIETDDRDVARDGQAEREIVRMAPRACRSEPVMIAVTPRPGGRACRRAAPVREGFFDDGESGPRRFAHHLRGMPRPLLGWDNAQQQRSDARKMQADRGVNAEGSGGKVGAGTLSVRR